MKNKILLILFLAFVSFMVTACSDDEVSEVEQTAPTWAIGKWKTTSDVAENYQIEFEITEKSFQDLNNQDEPYVFGKEDTLTDKLPNGEEISWRRKWVVSKRTDSKFVLDSYVDGKNLGPHFGLEKDGDKVYYRDWDNESEWGLTKDRWEVVKQ